jgi:hypothetical protein
MVLPCRADDLTDDPDYRTRMHRLTFRHAHAILDTVQELASLGLIQDADVQIRAHRFMTLCEDMAGGMGGTRAVG